MSRVLIAAILSLTTLLGPPAMVNAQDKPLLAVMEIDDRNNIMEEGVAGNLTEYLRGLVTESGRFVVIDRGRYSNAMKTLVKQEKKESYKQCYDRSCQVPLGRALAADKILVASVLVLGTKIIVKAEIVNLATEASESGATSQTSMDPQFGRVDRIATALGEVIAKLTGDGQAVSEVSRTHTVTAAPSTETVDMPVSPAVTLEERANRAEAEWAQINKIARDDRIPVSHRLQALAEFEKGLGSTEPFFSKVSSLREEVLRTPGFKKARTEWWGVRLGGGNYGFGGEVLFLNLRWPAFYWQVAKAGFYAFPSGMVTESSANMTTTFGWPWRLDAAGRHEIRFGIGTGLRFFENARMETESVVYKAGSVNELDKPLGDQFMGLGLSLEAVYSYNMMNLHSLQGGVELATGIVGIEDAECYDACGDRDDTYSSVPPAISVFVGYVF